MQRHLAKSMGGAAQAWVVSPDYCLDPVEHSFCNLCPVDKVLRHLQDAFIHRKIVVSCGDNEVGPLHQSVFISPVMMDECAARCLDASNAFPVVGLGKGADVMAQYLGII